MDWIQAFFKSHWNRKYIAPLVFTILLFGISYLRNIKYISSDGDANLCALIVTGLILLWYTFETSEMAQASQENLRRQKSPAVSCVIYQHSKLHTQTRLQLSNLSDYPLAARINCDFKVNNKPLDYSDAYNGRKYWNLQLKQTKEGHFSWIELLARAGFIRKVDLDRYLGLPIQNKSGFAIQILSTILNNAPPKLTMDLEVYCENEFGTSSYYPPFHYDYDYNSNVWIPILESDKPFWEFDSKPRWARG